jgi:Response regulator containing a CheY-like receiver domain and an HTH DNA-binding domain
MLSPQPAWRRRCIGSAEPVYVARTPEEVRSAVPKHRADVVIADLEVLGLSEIEQLHKDFDHLSIVTTHRVADEELWAQSLQAGAVDCCYPSDLRTILGSALGQAAVARPSRAA